MRMYWATIWSKNPEKDGPLRKSFFVTIEETQFKALVKITRYFQDQYWAGKSEKIVEANCEIVGELTPDNFGCIKLIP